MDLGFLGFPNLSTQQFQNQRNIPGDPGEMLLDADTKRRVAVWLTNSKRPLWIYGPTGCGKTMLAEWIAHKTGRGLIRFSGHGGIEIEDLIGHLTLVDGEVVHQDGPVTTAMKEGSMLVLDEGDLIHPDVWTSLHAVLEGNPLVINKGGVTTIQPRPGFQIIVTANSKGNGENRDSYRGTKEMNQATLNRFTRLRMDYMPEPVELGIVKAKASPKMRGIADRFIQAANKIRESHIKGELSRGISTRDIIAWMATTKLFVETGLGPHDALIEALGTVWADGLDDDEAVAAKNLAILAFPEN
ncbi:MoxR family ATPase [Acidithiobacillus caldus ATCC 51756]|jgi:cobaltochelatase CobS|uniref:AAA family ATPase n=1 Tax=Acidithiobacillus caldus TaxID=33059 RepID=UPI001C0729E0|nr:MoxR family ATPase [Acidithiobacillus caldus]MBU2735925.1 MoxR family ATPase [Acidithiobacillus caldus ATCC 51756]MBU2803153.1 MoxR family ATPase [Acidithiobacillus caldus]